LTIPATAALPRILVVDDEPEIRHVFVRGLGRRGYQMCEAPSVDQALDLLASESPFDLIVSDFHMPGRDGLSLLREVRTRYPETGFLILTGNHQASTAVECLKLGADDYLLKPVEIAALAARIAKILEERQRARALRDLQADYQRDLQRKVLELSKANEEMFMQQVKMAVTMLEARDTYTRGHSQRVSEHAVAVAHHLGLAPALVDEIRLGAELHDIGKIGTRDAVLHKRDQLTHDEFEEIRRHVTDGEEMLSVLRADHPVLLQVVRSHHERMDGAGYPDGLAGEQIPIAARIVCVADAFDAMVSKRPYRDAADVKSALRELRDSAGPQFDPAIVAAFVAVCSGADAS